jgi:tRNA pseudouridine13 synthase
MILRATPEDFRVDEIPLYAPSGDGAHTFVRVEKRLRNTEQVARDLARAAGVRPADVGYAGRKDRVAVATQWFSVPGLDPGNARELELPGARVLEAERHGHKLRTGQLRANRFELLVREVAPALRDAAPARLAELVRVGLPNRFGNQRFGRDRENLERAARILGGARIRDRRDARFLISALQAAVFNEVLARRVEGLDRVIDGDVAVVHASGGLFRVDEPELEAPRAAAFEISATGPIFGTRVLEPGGVVAAREGSVLEAHGIAIATLRPPRGIRLRGARRALRVRPQHAEVEATAAGLRLAFTLPPGSYATVLVEELLGPTSDDIQRPAGVP